MNEVVPLRRAHVDASDHAQDWLHDRLTQFVEERDLLVAAIGEQILRLSGYQDLSASEATAIRLSVGAVFDAFAGQTVNGGGQPALAELLALQELGAMRARQSIPLEQVVAEFRTGFRACESRLRELIGRGPGEDCRQAVESRLTLLPVLHTEAELAIRQGHAAVKGVQSSSRSPSRTALLHELLDAPVGQAMVLDFAARLGQSHVDECTLVVAVPANQDLNSAPYRLADELAAVIPRAVAAVIRLDPVPHAIILALGRWHPTPVVEAAVQGASVPGGRSLRVAVGRLAEVGGVYRQLRPLLPMSVLLTDDDGVLCSDLLTIYRDLVVIPEHEAHRIVRERLGQLLALASETAEPRLNTLEAFLEEGGNVTATAKRLPSARGTVYDHVRHIEELTGLDLLDSPRHRLIVDQAVLLLHLHRRALPSFGDPWWSIGPVEGPPCGSRTVATPAAVAYAKR